jgi:putative transposase
MPLGLKRYRHEGDDHFITFSCYRREPCFTTTASKDIFLDSLELTHKRYNFKVLGYVVMPEHVHLLLSEPLDREVPLSKALQSLKLSVSINLHLFHQESIAYAASPQKPSKSQPFPFPSGIPLP